MCDLLDIWHVFTGSDVTMIKNKLLSVYLSTYLSFYDFSDKFVVCVSRVYPPASYSRVQDVIDIYIIH